MSKLVAVLHLTPGEPIFTTDSLDESVLWHKILGRGDPEMSSPLLELIFACKLNAKVFYIEEGRAGLGSSSFGAQKSCGL